MGKRSKDAAFYGLLASVATAAIVLSVVSLHHGRPAAVSANTSTQGPPGGGPAHRAAQDRKPREQASAQRISRSVPVVTVAAVRGPSWIVIRARYTGPVLYRGILQRGQQLRLRGRALWAQIGAVENVDVRFRRRPVQLGSTALTGVILTAQGPVATQPGGAGIIGS